MAFTKKQKLDLHNQLENSLLDLQNLGWPINKIELLKKHFGFYVGLVNGYIEPKDSVHQDFIKKIKNWKTSVPKNIHEEIYINYIKYNSNKNLQISNNKDLSILINTEQNFKTDLGAQENLLDFEDEVLKDIINPAQNYETV